MCQLLTCWLRSDLILTLIPADFIGKCMEWRALLAAHLKILKEEAHEGELAAFASYAIAFPDGFLALVDTYDVTRYIRCLIQGCKMGNAKSLDFMGLALGVGKRNRFYGYLDIMGNLTSLEHVMLQRLMGITDPQ